MDVRLLLFQFSQMLVLRCLGYVRLQPTATICLFNTSQITLRTQPLEEKYGPLTILSPCSRCDKGNHHTEHATASSDNIKSLMTITFFEHLYERHLPTASLQTTRPPLAAKSHHNHFHLPAIFLQRLAVRTVHAVNHSRMKISSSTLPNTKR